VPPPRIVTLDAKMAPKATVLVCHRRKPEAFVGDRKLS
jgi:hypothetical protein